MHRPVFIATSLVALAACGGTPANQAAQAPGGPSAQTIPSIPGQPPARISVATPEGRAEIRSGVGTVPYPEGIPQYPGATADQSVDVSGAAQGGGRILGFRTSDPAARVIGYYADAGARAGYRVAGRIESGPNATLILQRGGDETVSISATRIGDFTQGQIVVPDVAAGR